MASAYQRADIISRFQMPDGTGARAKEEMIREINPLPHQRFNFSYYRYGKPYYIFNPAIH